MYTNRLILLVLEAAETLAFRTLNSYILAFHEAGELKDGTRYRRRLRYQNS